MSKIKYFKIIEKSKGKAIAKLKALARTQRPIIIEKPLNSRNYLERFIKN